MAASGGCWTALLLVALVAAARGSLVAAGQGSLVAAGQRSPVVDPAPCQPRPHYAFSVLQMDSEGRACWGQIRVMVCWGHCHTHEVS